MGKDQDQTRGHRNPGALAFLGWTLLLGATLATSAVPLAAKIKKSTPQASSDIELSATLADAVKAVEEAAADPIVYGTYVYERDKTLTGARLAETSSAFGKELPQGKVFYKVLDDVIAPRHFKETEDSGTVTVRYVVRELGPARVAIHIDAVFVESARRAVHASEGGVESAESGQIQQHLNRIQAREKEALEEAEEEARAKAGQPVAVASTEPQLAAPPAPVQHLDDNPPAPMVPSPDSGSLDPGSLKREGARIPASGGPVAELEQRVKRLRHEVEARVKAPGAPLKSAPFHTATTIQTLPADSEVAIVILTIYWYGVQTTDGHTGWIRRSQLESLP